MFRIPTGTKIICYTEKMDFWDKIDGSTTQYRRGWPLCHVKIPRRIIWLMPSAWVPCSKAANIYIPVYKTSAVAEMGDVPFGHNTHGPKIGMLCPFLEGDVSYVTQCGLSRGLPSYQVASWSIQPFRHNKHRPKIVDCAPILWRGAGSIIRIHCEVQRLVNIFRV